MQVNDIRPEKLMEGQKKALREDIQYLLNKKSDFVFINCPSCGSEEKTQRFEKNGFKYVTCETCKTFYVNPRPSEIALAEFYAQSKNYEYWNKFIFPASEAVRRQEIFVPRVNQVLDICKKSKISTGSLLEIGSGFGSFCEELISRNIFDRIVAVEPTPELAKTCRSKNIEVIEKPVEKIDPENNGSFDVIVHFEVIEHLFSPQDFITNCHRLLGKKGLMIFTCPNGEGFEVSVLGAKSDTVDHEHLNYFNPQSIEVLLSKNGFKIIESSTPGKLDADLVRRKILSGEFEITDHPFLKEVLTEKWDVLGGRFQDFISENNLSSNMLVVAEKV